MAKKISSSFGKLLLAAGCIPALSLHLMSSMAVAQTEIASEIRPAGVSAEVTVSDPATTRVAFVTTLKSNLSQYIDLAAQGPDGIKGYAEVRQVKRGGKLGPLYRIAFPKKKKGTTNILVDGSAQALRIGDSPITLAAGEEPTEEQLKRISEKTNLSVDTIRILLRYMSEEQIIAKYGRSTPTTPTTPGGSDPTPKTAPGSLAGRGMVSKDNCDKSVTEYQVKFVVDLSGIDRAAAGSTFSVSGSIKAGETQASVASIKPVSDGKFAPRPLILIQGVGYSYGSNTGEGLTLVKWKNGRPGKGKAIKVEDRIYYRGQALARSVADGILTGGKGTFEISNGTKVGVACFNLVRARQKANGYKGGD